MTRYRKKPVIVDAVRWTGQNLGDVAEFMSVGHLATENSFLDDRTTLLIETLEGTMRASEGDWIIRGVKGEHYPCKPDIFAETYEAVT